MFDYASFQVVFLALGGSRKTTVLFSDLVEPVGVDSQFRVAASFPDADITFNATSQNGSAKPATFDADFTQAIKVGSIGFG